MVGAAKNADDQPQTGNGRAELDSLYVNSVDAQFL